MITYQQCEFDALADPTRRNLLERLHSKPLPVGELARGLAVSRPAVSQHLRVLEKAKLVRHETVGTRNIYRIDLEGFANLRNYLDRFWGTALEAFKARIEEE